MFQKYTGFLTKPGGCLGFLNHQQYHRCFFSFVGQVYTPEDLHGFQNSLEVWFRSFSFRQMGDGCTWMSQEVSKWLVSGL